MSPAGHGPPVCVCSLSHAASSCRCQLQVLLRLELCSTCSQLDVDQTSEEVESCSCFRCSCSHLNELRFSVNPLTSVGFSLVM